MKTWIIYKYTLMKECKHKGWSYIGQTCQTPKIRAGSYGQGYCHGYQPCFEKEIKKYGWAAFKLTILETDILDIKTANAKEQYWIAHYHTYIKDPECRGYNMTPGGDARGEVSEKTKKLISSYAKTRTGEKNPFYGKHHSIETKKLIGQKSLGRQTFLGKKHKPESIAKMRQSQLGILPTNSKKVKCLNDGNIFRSYNKAANYYHISAGSVANSIKNCKPLRCGLQFININ